MAYDPSRPTANMTDYEDRKFEEVNVDELFYLSDNLRDVNSFRKINEEQAMNIRTRVIESVQPKTQVYVKN